MLLASLVAEWGVVLTSWTTIKAIALGAVNCYRRSTRRVGLADDVTETIHCTIIFKGAPPFRLSIPSSVDPEHNFVVHANVCAIFPPL